MGDIFAEGKNGTGTSTGDGKDKLFTQEEVNRIAGNAREEGRKAAMKDAEKEVDRVKQELGAGKETSEKYKQWHSFLDWLHKDPAAASRALASKYGGIQSDGGKRRSATDDDDEEEEVDPRLKTIEEKVDKLFSFVGGFVTDGDAKRLQKEYVRGGIFDEAEMKTAMDRAKDLMQKRQSLTLDEAFRLANGRAIELGQERKWKRASSDEDAEAGDPDVEAGGMGDEDDNDFVPPTLRKPSGGSRGKIKSKVKISEEDRAFIGPGKLFKTDEDFVKAVEKIPGGLPMLNESTEPE